MRVPKRRPPRPHSCRRSRSPLRQWAAAKPSHVTKPNSATKTTRAVQFTSCTAFLRFYCFSACASFLRREIDDRRQDGADDHPGELVPVEERNARQRGLELVVERRPEDRDELDEEEQVPPAPSGASFAVVSHDGHPVH